MSPIVSATVADPLNAPLWMGGKKICGLAVSEPPDCGSG
jgi:hypothetical protein